MKRILALIFLSTLATSIASAQYAGEGKAVVSHGFETCDSIRFGILRPYDVGYWTGYFQFDTLIDPLGCNAVEGFEPTVPLKAEKAFYGHQRVYCEPGILQDGYYGKPEVHGPNMNLLVGHLQRLFLPAAPQQNFKNGFRYNDLSFNSNARVFNNTYDSNDISPYYEYPAKHSYVTDSFWTTRFNTGSDTTKHLAYYGNEGRVIMGYSDDRDAQKLMFPTIEDTNNGYPVSMSLHDTAKAFSVTLEFWADTLNIDTALSSFAANPDSIPLVRLQVLYKKGASGLYPGQPVLPFVPFTNGSDGNPGWYKCLDIPVNRAMYRALDSTWRADDSTFDANGTGHVAHHWRFRQLHAIISLSDSMKKLLNNPTDYGAPAGGSSISTYQHPDSLVAYGTSLTDKSNNILEIRVLSMYRDTVRVRSLVYEDTIVDKYLYRRRSGSTTHSLNPDGTPGGNDSLVNATFQAWQTKLGAYLPREVMYNDVGLQPASFPMMGYLDYMGGKHQIYAHTRPQDYGDWSQLLRRSRESLDGGMPSIFENQEGGYYVNIIPLDYMFYGHKIELTKPWGASIQDTSWSLIVARAGQYVPSGSDSLAAYNVFSNQTKHYCHTYVGIREMARVASIHPASKRFAVEYSIKDFSYPNNGSYVVGSVQHFPGSYNATLGVWVTDSGHSKPSPYCGTVWQTDSAGWNNSFTPLIPEMITAQVYGAFGNGATAISAAEAFGNPSSDWQSHAVGLFTPTSGAGRVYNHSYNVGHYFSTQDNSGTITGDSIGTDQDGPLQPCYLGMSNTYRAFGRAVARMNQIWSHGPHPMKNFRWLDAYSTYDAWKPSSRVVNPTGRDECGNPTPDALLDLMDSVSDANAFFKISMTVPVQPWSRKKGAYIDMPDSLADRDTNTSVEVGLFIDSVDASSKNYAVMVINERYWPSLRDKEDSIYYNRGVDSISRCRSTLGDIDVRKVFMRIDTNNFPASFRYSSYQVFDLWKPDSSWLVPANTDFYAYIKPGDAKFFYIQAPASLPLTKVNTNRWNNSRHMIEQEWGDTLHSYWCTYERDGNIYAISPRELPSTSYQKRELTSADTEYRIDSSGRAHNPALSLAQDSLGAGVGMVYSIDKSGSNNKTTYIVYRNQPAGILSHLERTVVLDSFTVSTIDSPFVAAPAISPVNHQHLGTRAWADSAMFWVSWRRPNNGACLTMVDTGLTHSNIIHFSAGDSASTKFISITSRSNYDHYSSWNGFDKCYMAFEENNSIYYLTAYPSTTANVIDTTGLLNISKGLGTCYHRTPNVAIDLWGDVHAVWEAYYLFSTPLWSSWDHFAVHREKGSLNPSNWLDFTAFHAHTVRNVYNGFSYPVDTLLLLPQVTCTSQLGGDYLPAPFWNDWTRMMWSNNYSNRIGIAHHGLILGDHDSASLWRHNTLIDSSLEPSLAYLTTTTSYVPEPVFYRGPTGDTSGHFPGKITQYNFPITPISGTDYVKQTLGAFNSNLCPMIWVTAGGEYGTPKFFSSSNPDDPISIPWLPLDVNGNDSGATHAVISWSSPTVRTATFFANPGDSIQYARMFGLGTGRVGDTLDLKNALAGYNSGDYIRGSLNLRQASTGTIVKVLDTCLLNASGFVSSTDRASAVSSTAISTVDSFFLSLDMKRGDTTDQFVISHIESYGDDLSYWTEGDSSLSAYKRSGQSPNQSLAMRNDPFGVRVYPNPASDRVLICVDEIPKDNPFFAEVVDATGAHIATIYDATPEADLGICYRLDCSQLATGTYYVRVANAIQGSVTKFQVVK